MFVFLFTGRTPNYAPYLNIDDIFCLLLWWNIDTFIRDFAGLDLLTTNIPIVFI